MGRRESIGRSTEDVGGPSIRGPLTGVSVCDLILGSQVRSLCEGPGNRWLLCARRVSESGLSMSDTPFHGLGPDTPNGLDVLLTDHTGPGFLGFDSSVQPTTTTTIARKTSQTVPTVRLSRSSTTSGSTTKDARAIRDRCRFLCLAKGSRLAHPEEHVIKRGWPPWFCCLVG